MLTLLKAIKGESDPTHTDTKSNVQETLNKKPLSEISLIDTITEFYGSPDQRPAFRPGIHPSEISYEDPFCPRWHMYRKQLVKAQEEGRKELPFGVKIEDRQIDADLYRIFDMGHSIHEMYQDRILGKAGVLYGYWSRWNDKNEKWESARGFRPQGDAWRYTEPKVRSRGIRGQCDGIVRVDDRWLALEIKSSNDQAFNFRKRVKKEHMRQAQIYAEIGFVDFPEVEVEGIVFLYVNKNTSKEREFIVPRDPNEIRDILEGLEALATAEKEDRLPERICVRPNSKRANACPVKADCFERGADREALIQIRNA